MADTVKLDVGGTVFKTTKSTLTKFDGFFRTMFETLTPVPKDDSGAIFIDRDPTHFRLILNFMRDGHVDLRKYSEDMTEIQKEAQYYLLGGLMELCASKPESQKMPYFAETYEDMARTVASSTKKVVCTVFFGTTHRNHNTECSMKAIMLYGDKVDFCFIYFGMVDIVKLDVGGTVFKTSKSTLAEFDVFFRKLLETRIPFPKDESNSIFMDRDTKEMLLY